MKYRKWSENYDLAKQLYAEIGTINVPINYDFHGVNIGYWLSRQRTSRNRNELSQEKIRLLEDLEIEWDGRQNKRDRELQEFSKRIQLLKDYKLKYGNTRVPSTYTVGDFALGKWLTNMRHAYNHPEWRALSQDQLRMLDEVGFEPTWYEEELETTWELQYHLLAEFISINGINAVLEDTIYKEHKIGSWLHYQRGKYNSGTLSKEKYDQLCSIGILFDPMEQRWEWMYSLASCYYQEFNNLDVPDGLVLNDEDLGRWISYQREKYNRRDNSISAEKISMLESIGMKWEVGKGGSSSFAEQAIFYYLRSCFPDTINRDTSFGFELDNYIPSLHLAIEYDGEYWHRKKQKQDNEKDKKCISNGITLIRIREYPLSYTNSAVCYQTKAKYSREVIEEVIKTVFKEQLKIDIDVDVARDAFTIIKEFQRYSSKAWYSLGNTAQRYRQSQRCVIM